PEFIGRLPVITRVTALDRAALLRTLTEPRNALVKQYQRLFELDGVQLEFDRPALDAIIDRALLRGTGARALRGVMERVLQPLMYEIPGRADITHVVVDEGTVRRHTDGGRIPRQRTN
ncbi:ATP-dependent Clp protease ATP-binding subunit ClpX, partial [Vibrio vulnificus]|nr:ATP-dependent Clp protease ATP-binding subunit ClpX [Vibrio vulnificus]